MRAQLSNSCHLVAWLCITISVLQNVNAKREKRQSDSGSSEWMTRTECSRSCGGGVQIKYRICTGQCSGPDEIYTTCNLQPCPKGSLDFRLEQCQKFNNVGINIPEGSEEVWVPYYGGSDKCQLNCLLKGTRFYYTLAPKVVDGTPCDLDTRDICVNGVCQSVGCDGLLGSDKQYDTCSVCGGDDSTCESYRGDISTQDLQMGYNDVMIIPERTTSLSIMEHSHSHNYLALRSSSGDYVLNKDWQIERSQNIELAGTTFQYKREGHRETLTADGPLTEPVYLVIIKQAGHGAMFRYQYSVPHELSRTRGSRTYDWHVGDWGSCSAECAGGSETRDVSCTTSDGVGVQENLCNPLYRPTETRDCNVHPCAASWHSGEWQPCSASCGKGLQVRVVYCKQSHSKGVHAIAGDVLCSGEPRPDHLRTCNEDIKCPKWVVGEWSRCNRVCGSGQRVRSITCQAQHQIPNALSNILPDQRCREEKPLNSEPCNEGPCHGVEWITSDWSGCHGTCSHGVETRQVICSSRSGQVHEDSMCDASRRPSSSRTCAQDETACEPKPQWHASQWSKCTARCGPGVQRRKVICAQQDGKNLLTLTHSDCDPDHKMAEMQSCNGTDCRGDWFTGPFGKCSAACGGGQRQRQVMCFVGGVSSDLADCDANLRPDASEDCNLDACDDDDLIVIGGCKKSAYGCCPDGITAAEGDNFYGCPSQDRIPVGLCIEAEFGCCLDGVSQALGPFGYGCPEYSCRDTKHGCCPDGETPADGPHGQGCPVHYTCHQKAFGCCPDGVTPANGFNNEGCDTFAKPHCGNTIFGCCEDGMTTAQGANKEGCVEEGSGEIATCELSEFGCCYDGMTPASGPHQEGCNEIDCNNSLLGCCPDGITPVSGPGYQGCVGIYVPETPLCATSQYGCCPDGERAAAGYNHEGCDPAGCQRSQYGCCPDGTTEALSVDGDGCDIEVTLCGDTRFGCCPDFITAAQGPGFMGCPGGTEGDCENTLFGCCSDGITAAGGSTGEGCPVLIGGCAGTRHGCCPDGLTAAHGPNNEECPGEETKNCHNSLFGCCPGSDKFAEGPRHAGCAVESKETSCDQTAYGCCLDGVSVATGEDFAGCSGDKYVSSCQEAAYGCCPDGATEARGPNNAGCPSMVENAAACGLLHDRGSCSNYSVQWRYDPSYGDCSRFWYGGCDGNGNRFETKELCKAQCINPLGLERCYLPKSIGRCQASEEKYYYNHETGMCESFIYGGCLGNDNRFDDLDECIYTCVEPHQKDACNQPVSVGPCRGRYRRWYFDEETQTCRDFVYGGCKGNDNRFESKEACEGRCLTPHTNVCTLDKDPGPCKALFPQWFFNQESRECQVFTYGGCRGNGNRFSSKLECQNACKKITEVEKDICSMPRDAGPCNGYMERWSYNQDSGYCERFIYGGCQGNDNRFESEATCRQTCNAQPPIDVCSLPMDVGPCPGNKVRYYYDVLAQRCMQMTYGGCDGNKNNFQTVEECQKVCGGRVAPPTAAPTRPTTAAPTQANKCDLSLDPGPCLQSMARWYYDRSTHTCRRFEYGGCEGNRNRFLSVEHCINECGGKRETEPPTTTTTTTTTSTTTATTTTTELYEEPYIDVCSMEQDSGECLAHIPSWYFDSKSGGCEQFIYGGCGGNENRFETRERCEAKCGILLPEVTGLDICALEAVTGPCQAGEMKYHFDMEEGMCTRFTFGGCQGNANNFDSKKDCQQACPVEDICRLPKKAGQCRARKTRFFYNAETSRCEQFRYGGCNGNANRFQSLENCIRVCANESTQALYTTPQPTRPVELTHAPTHLPDATTQQPPRSGSVCQLAKDPGPCKGYNAVWYFEPVTRTCRRFLYGGCEGNGNRYETREECQQTCLFTEAETPAPTQPPVTTTTQVVVPTEYAEELFPGLIGSGSDASEDITDFSMCLAEKDAGDYCTGWDLRWHFDPKTAACRQFYYGGCKGNANRFNSEEDCLKTCVETDHSTDKEEDVCAQKKTVGPCQAFKLRYYFDQKEGRCLSFQFGGCQGNKNNFENEKECYKSCSNHMVEEKKDKTKADCRLPKEPGPCQADFTRFFYDSGTGLCRPFIYGGCQGNGNNFETQTECHKMCSAGEQTPRVYSPGDCYDPHDMGTCNDVTPRWYFDHNKGDCQPFYYSGCEGNGNNFLNYEDCTAFCSKISETCGVLQCNLNCPFGFSRGPDGCPKCECRDPCLTHQCPSDKECRQEQVVCVREPCKPLVVCRPKPKAGECPKLESDNMAMCVTECQEDVDCRGDAKCCSNGCGLVCVVPYTPECRKSVFGCCPDGETQATGWNFIGCPEEAPVIEEFGQLDIVAVLGVEVTIPCVSKGAPTPQVTWYKSRFPLQAQDSKRMAQQKDGSLVINSVQPDDSTSYTCRAFNNIGSATRTYTLLVQVPVVIEKISESKQVGPGEDIKLTCMAVGNPTPEIRWLHGNKVILTSNPRYFVDKDGTLLIERAVMSDEGEYMCEANNGVGEPVTASTRVDVLGPFMVDIAPHNLTVTVGSDLRLVCQVTGDLTDVTIHWLKDNFPLLDDEDHRIKVRSTGELQIDDMMKSDEGRYTCSARRYNSEISKSTSIYTEGIRLPKDCSDKPWYANCQLIIEARMCRHAYFKVFCCKSCHEAGLLP